MPVPGRDEVLIRTQAATICTSDLHDLKSNPFGINYPRIMGHEGAGIVVESGADVHNLPHGTRVAAHPVIPCGTCTECRRGLNHLCSIMSHLGIDKDGCFAEYFVLRADRVRAIPDQLPFPLAALLEPVAVCLQALARAGDVSGKKVLIVGDGPFGNNIARLSTRAGAAVTVSGREPFRLSKIPGVVVTTNPPANVSDIAILAVSAEDAVNTCLNALRPRGRMVVFSTITGPLKIDLFKLHVAELEMVGACNDEHKIDDALAYLSATPEALQEIVTHHIPFENWKDAFSLAANKHDEALKVAILFPQFT
ncbi:zinc-dependent alcohol dehydrogenase [Pedobacter sp.]|uniref:zinc-dependent alcohol dehydrogenase n=1 Tax=Pedobacter sp. TaxID=1411316 RepID=UPI003D7F8EA1